MYIKRILFISAVSATLLWAYHITSPSISLLNSSENRVINARITLTNEDLAFGDLNNGEDKELSYSLLSGTGQYTYYFELSNDQILSGRCGSFKNFELSKRVIFMIGDNQVIAQDITGEPVLCQSFHV